MNSLHAITVPGDPKLPALVLLHGRGSDERDLLPVGRLLHPAMTVISVRAPFDAAPWGYGPGYAWYRYLGGTTPEPDSFVAGQEALAGFLATLREAYGVASGHFLGGFSQGGTTALGYSLRHPGAVRGVLVFSGFLADHPSVVVSPTTAGTPIYWGHGTADPAIGYDKALAGWQTLEGSNAPLTAKSYPGQGHTIGTDEVSDAREWLAQQLA